MDELFSILSRIPVGLLFFGFLVYLGYDYYSFFNTSASPFLDKMAQIQAADEATIQSRKKISSLQDFIKKLQEKKIELQALLQELQGMKESLSEKSNIAEKIEMIVEEAKKNGIQVLGIKPGETLEREYYTEKYFSISFNAVFHQFVIFLEKISQFSEIIVIHELTMHSLVPNAEKYVMLEGLLKVKTYVYRGSSADGVSDLSSIPNFSVD